MTPPERLQDVIAEMREWAHGEGCFNDDPEGEPLLCVYYSQRAFLSLCDRIEAAAALSVRGWPKGVLNRKATLELLSSHNAWRRGAEGPQTDPRMLGLALDAAVAYIATPPSEG